MMTALDGLCRCSAMDESVRQARAPISSPMLWARE